MKEQRLLLFRHFKLREWAFKFRTIIIEWQPKGRRLKRQCQKSLKETDWEKKLKLLENSDNSKFIRLLNNNDSDEVLIDFSNLITESFNYLRINIIKL